MTVTGSVAFSQESSRHRTVADFRLPLTSSRSVPGDSHSQPLNQLVAYVASRLPSISRRWMTPGPGPSTCGIAMSGPRVSSWGWSSTAGAAARAGVASVSAVARAVDRGAIWFAVPATPHLSLRP